MIRNEINPVIKNRMSAYTITVINASFEDYSFPIYGRYFDFHGRTKQELPEFTETGDPFEWPIENEHSDKGLFVFRAGDDYKAKELDALSRYLHRLETRIKNYQKKIDEKKAAGQHVQGIPQKMQQAQDWIKQIKELLQKNDREEITKSFIDDAKPLVDSVDFKAAPQVEQVKPVTSKKQSFKEVGAQL